MSCALRPNQSSIVRRCFSSYKLTSAAYLSSNAARSASTLGNVRHPRIRQTTRSRTSLCNFRSCMDNAAPASRTLSASRMQMSASKAPKSKGCVLARMKLPMEWTNSLFTMSPRRRIFSSSCEILMTSSCICVAAGALDIVRMAGSSWQISLWLSAAGRCKQQAPGHANHCMYGH